MDFGIDSDNNNSPAVVRLYTGPYKGAVLKASQAKLGGDGVVIHMTTMYWNRKNYRVDAYALKDDTLMANVATDVNHHYMSRILLPSIAAGIGKAGDLYADANTEILTNGYSTVTSHAGMPDGEAVAGVVAGAPRPMPLTCSSRTLPKFRRLRSRWMQVRPFMSSLWLPSPRPMKSSLAVRTAPAIRPPRRRTCRTAIPATPFRRSALRSHSYGSKRSPHPDPVKA